MLELLSSVVFPAILKVKIVSSAFIVSTWNVLTLSFVQTVAGDRQFVVMYIGNLGWESYRQYRQCAMVNNYITRNMINSIDQISLNRTSNFQSYQKIRSTERTEKRKK